MPERGPEPIRRMSLAILNKPAARLASAPWANTSASWEASASNLFGAEVNGQARQLGDLGGETLGELAGGR